MTQSVGMDDLKTRTLVEAVGTFGLAHQAEVIVSAARTSIRLRPSDRDRSDTNTSRLGGGAALPKGMTWPAWKGLPQSLVAQIILSEIADLDSEDILPGAGKLLFFYDSEQETWGFDPNDRGSWRVVFVADNVPVDTYHDPGVYRSVALVPSAEISLPPWESLWFESPGIGPESVDPYLDLRASLSGDELIHKMLGYPDPVQNEMQMECQLVSNGIYCGDADGYKNPRAEALRPGATDWRLLLQIDSEEDRAGMMWGDVGRLYFWIREQDLRRRDFDGVWCILQCC